MLNDPDRPGRIITYYFSRPKFRELAPNKAAFRWIGREITALSCLPINRWDIQVLYPKFSGEHFFLIFMAISNGANPVIQHCKPKFMHSVGVNHFVGDPLTARLHPLKHTHGVHEGFDYPRLSGG
jgi:hypothetical protein